MAYDMNTVLSAVSQNARKADAQNQGVSTIKRSVLTSYVDPQSDLGIFAPGSSAGGGSQSAYEQVAPSETNRVPRIYGQCTTGGVIVDSYRHSSNTTSYVIVLSEYNPDFDIFRENESGEFSTPEISWQIGYWERWATEGRHAASVDEPEIYRDGEMLKFTGATEVVLGTADPNGANADQSSADVEFSNAAISVAVFAGGVGNANCIFPETPITATSLHPPAVSGTYTDLVFAVVKVTTNDDEDVRGLGEFKFRIVNYASYWPQYVQDVSGTLHRSANNPAIVLRDYLTNTNYGLGLDSSYIDDTSFLEWEAYCRDANGIYLDKRYLDTARQSVETLLSASDYAFMVNGQINTNNPVGENIRRITQCGLGNLIWDYSLGKFRMTWSGLQSANDRAGITTTFNPDNIIGSITVNSAGINDLTNVADVTYPDLLNYGDSATVRVALEAGELNQNEPESIDSYNFDLIVHSYQALKLGNITLHENRLDTVVSLTADFSTKDVEVGDYVKLTDPLYGFDDDVFRVIRKTETQGADGLLVYGFILREYSDYSYLPQAYTNDWTDSPQDNLLADAPLPEPRIEHMGMVDEYNTSLSANDQPAIRWDFNYANSSTTVPSSVTTTTGTAFVVMFPELGSTPQGPGNICLSVELADINQPSVSEDYNRLELTLTPANTNPMYGHSVAGQPITMLYGLDSNISGINQEISGTSSNTVFRFPLYRLPARAGTDNKYVLTCQYLNTNYYPPRRSEIFSTEGIVDIPIDVVTVTGSNVANTYGANSTITETFANSTLSSLTLTSGTTHNPALLELDQYELVLTADFGATSNVANVTAWGLSTSYVDLDISAEINYVTTYERAERLFSGNVQWTQSPNVSQELHYNDTKTFRGVKRYTGTQLFSGGTFTASTDISNLPEFRNQDSVVYPRWMNVAASITTNLDYSNGSPVSHELTNIKYEIRPKSRMWGDYR